jgi:hypothetical protein
LVNIFNQVWGREHLILCNWSALLRLWTGKCHNLWFAKLRSTEELLFSWVPWSVNLWGITHFPNIFSLPNSLLMCLQKHSKFIMRCLILGNGNLIGNLLGKIKTKVFYFHFLSVLLIKLKHCFLNCFLMFA